MVLVSSVGKVSDYESFQLAALIVCVPVQPGAECAKNYVFYEGANCSC